MSVQASNKLLRRSTLTKYGRKTALFSEDITLCVLNIIQLLDYLLSIDGLTGTSPG